MATNAASALARLQALYAAWDQNPGRAPNGTGTTGLLPNDAQGWSRMLNEQTEGVNLEHELAGESPLSVRAEFTESLPPGIDEDPTSTFNTSTGPYGRFGVGTGGNVPTGMTPADQLAGLSTGKKKPLSQVRK